jgi:hypothetical protein
VSPDWRRFLSEVLLAAYVGFLLGAYLKGYWA